MTPASKAPTMTTAELERRLRAHYLAPSEMLPGGVFVPEVGGNGTAFRRCDAIYVGFTSVSGRILVGHELKVSRADWRHELDTREKADQWSDACHAWYVVAPSTDIVPVEEVPPGWGLMTPDPRSKRRFKVHLRAHIKEQHDPPWWACRAVLARQDTIRAADTRTRINDVLGAIVAALRAGSLGDPVSVAKVSYWEYYRTIHHAATEFAKTLHGASTSTTLTEARDLVEAFRRAGVMLTESDWRLEAHALSPELAARYIEALHSANVLDRIARQVGQQHQSLPGLTKAVARLNEELAKFVLDASPRDAVG